MLSQGSQAICVVSLLMGFAVLALALLLHRRYRHEALRQYAIFMACALFIGGVSFLGMVRWRPALPLAIVIGTLVLPSLAGLCISLAHFILALLEIKPSRRLRALVWLPAPLLLVGTGIQLATLPSGLGALGRVTGQIAVLGFLGFFAEWLALSILVSVRFRRIPNPEVRQGILGMLLIMLTWIPFWIWEVATHRPTLSPYVFGIFACGLSLAMAARHFFSPAQEVAMPEVPAPANPGPLADAAMLERFSKARKLTPREQELCVLLVDGLNHAAIAQRLFISDKTVRNHVSNIYAKVGVSSRLELIQAIRTA